MGARNKSAHRLTGVHDKTKGHIKTGASSDHCTAVLDNQAATLHRPQACTATRPSCPAPQRAERTRELETSSLGERPRGSSEPPTVKRPDLTRHAGLGRTLPSSPRTALALRVSRRPHGGPEPCAAGPGDGRRGPATSVRQEEHRGGRTHGDPSDAAQRSRAES